jgi:hypothetical protein
MIEIIHGRIDNRCTGEWSPETERDHRFICIECSRLCCACVGSACDIDEQCEEPWGLCCDCWVAQPRGRKPLVSRQHRCREERCDCEEQSATS